MFRRALRKGSALSIFLYSLKTACSCQDHKPGCCRDGKFMHFACIKQLQKQWYLAQPSIQENPTIIYKLVHIIERIICLSFNLL